MLKKILAFLICFNIGYSPAYCAINDDFADRTLSKELMIQKAKNPIIIDEFAESMAKKTPQTKAGKALFSENKVPIKIRIKKHLSTKHEVDEGDYVEFETLSEVKIKNKVYPRGTTVRARIETISQNKIWGVPSDLVVGNFTIDEKPLYGEISKTGANRSLWLYPTIYTTTFFLGIGLLLIPIRGGHAKITPAQAYTINYIN